MLSIHHLYLGLAILAEVVATTALARTEGFTRLGPTALSLGLYGIAFYLLALTLRVMPTGVVYAVWSGMGIVFIAVAFALPASLRGEGQKVDAGSAKRA